LIDGLTFLSPQEGTKAGISGCLKPRVGLVQHALTVFAQPSVNAESIAAANEQEAEAAYHGDVLEEI
jgi:hypothetical protein